MKVSWKWVISIMWDYDGVSFQKHQFPVKASSSFSNTFLMRISFSPTQCKLHQIYVYSAPTQDTFLSTKEWLTDTCENIIFPQLLLRAIINQHY